MASAWGSSWGAAWGNSWGSIVTVPPTAPPALEEPLFSDWLLETDLVGSDGYFDPDYIDEGYFEVEENLSVEAPLINAWTKERPLG